MKRSFLGSIAWMVLTLSLGLIICEAGWLTFFVILIIYLLFWPIIEVVGFHRMYKNKLKTGKYL